MARTDGLASVSFTTHGGYVLTAENDNGGNLIVADRTQVHAWELFHVEHVDAEHIALIAWNGAYVCAEDGGGRELVANRYYDAPRSWERFKVVRTEFGIALQTHDGSFVRAVNGGGGGVLCDRREAKGHETFVPSEDIFVQASIVGQLGIRDRMFVDARGPINPVFCHFGDAFSAWVRDPARVESMLRVIKAAGYHGIRFWTILFGEFWEGREVHPGRPNYVDNLTRFLRMVKSLGLTVVMSQGDAMRYYERESDRLAFASVLSDIIAAVGPEVVAFVDAGNETWNDNGESDPARLARFMRVIKTRHPQVLCSLSSPDEGNKNIASWSQAPADVHDDHSQAGDVTGNIRHIWNAAYENTAKWLGIQSEPRGAGRNVTVWNDYDEDAMQMFVRASLMSGQAYVFMSSVGVISDGQSFGRFDAGERFEDMPGFFSTPKIAAAMPKTIASWRRVHGGLKSPDRVYSVPAEDETRADHAIGPNGELYVLIHGPRWQGVYEHRPHRVSSVTQNAHGKVIEGALL